MAWGRVDSNGFLACKSVLWWQWRMGTCTHADVRAEGYSWEQEFSGTGLWRDRWHFELKSASIIPKLASFLADWANTCLICSHKPTSQAEKVSVSFAKLRVRFMLPFRQRQVPAVVLSKVWGDVAFRVSTPHLQASQPGISCVSGA